ncbi:MAG: hypothetical protein ACRCX2_00775 [Paraclostridium sp.]
MAKKLIKKAKKGLIYTVVNQWVKPCPTKGAYQGCAQYPSVKGKSIDRVYFPLIKDYGKENDFFVFTGDNWIPRFMKDYGLSKVKAVKVAHAIILLQTQVEETGVWNATHITKLHDSLVGNHNERTLYKRIQTTLTEWKNLKKTSLYGKITKF